MQLTRTHRGSNRSLPADATTTIVNATSDSNPSTPTVDLKEGAVNGGLSTSDDKKIGLSASSGNGALPSPKAEISVNTTKEDEGSQTRGGNRGSAHASTSWLPWFSRVSKSGEPEMAPTDGDKSKIGETTQDVQQNGDTNKSQIPAENNCSVPEELSTGKKVGNENIAQSQPQGSSSQKRSWLQMWTSSGGGRVLQGSADEAGATTTQSPANATSGSTFEPNSAAIHNAPPSAPRPAATKIVANNESQPNSQASSMITSPPDLPGDGSKSGWIFWSRDRKSSVARSDGAHVGELAISDTPTQKKPKRASISIEESNDKPKDDTSKTIPREVPKDAPKIALLGSKSKKQTVSDPLPQPKTPEPPSPVKGGKGAELLEASKQLHRAIPNLVLPTFRNTFSLQDNPTLWQQITRMLSYSKTPEPRHMGQLRDPPRIKNAIAIGVHGYFPAPLIRSVLGQPTGTSIKFADMAAKAIRKWTNSQGYDCEVKTAALEGEGRVAERVDILWKLLLNWIEEIRKADFIFVACHSQGVPVAVMLIAKLIAFGCVNSARIGVCAMAGVNMGPFPDYKTRWLGSSASELFEFSDPTTPVSKDYLTSLEKILNFGVKTTYVGSIDDQLVSMESSTYSPVSHPHIYRAVFVDSRVHAPSFLTHLVGFALKLRNLGVPDHGLIRELSSPLAGSLYSGEGHSRLYEEEAVYDLAIEVALETTSIDNAPLSQRPGIQNSQNPYILPFAMRGLLEEEYVRTELFRETNELLKQFDEWRPTSKVLKDVKFRLEGVRSKL